jgi:endo-1,4-beta-D-glucanase Y
MSLHRPRRRSRALAGAVRLGFAAFGLALAACAATPATSAGTGGTTGPNNGTGGATGAGGNVNGRRLASGGPFALASGRALANCSITGVAGTVGPIQAVYSAWKTATVTGNGAGGNLRVQRSGANGNDTVSEGIGYGMLASVYLNDQTTFDGLWAYAQAHFDAKGLMNWHITATGTTASDGAGSASDGDLDIIWALIMASDQWKTDTYLNGAGALAMIDAMLTNSFAGDGTLKPGDNWGGTQLTNPSYFSPAYFRVFADITDNSQWITPILDRGYAILNNVSGTVGLVPDWTNTSSVVNQGFLTSMGTTGGTMTWDNSTYGYDATRTPWRIGLDYCLNGEARARTYLMKIGAFFNGITAPNVGDGYALSGSVKSNNKNMAFIGPAGVSGMVGYPSLVDGAFNYGSSGQGDQSYFPSSLRVLTMLTMSGNFLDFTKP